MRERFCRKCSQWHDIDEWPMACYEPPKAQSDVIPVPFFISDTMEPTEHVDGKQYTSKSAFRQVTKANGLVEVGNDPARIRMKPRYKPSRDEIKTSVQKAAARYRAGERI